MCANELLRVLRVERPAGEAAAGGQPDDDRHGRAGPVELLRRDGDQVVPGAGDEVGELHLGDRAHPHQRGAGARADDRGLGEGRVDHAPRAELLLEAERDLERAAVDADVFADHVDALVAAHLQPETVGDRLQVRQLGHGKTVTCGAACRGPRARRRRREEGRRIRQRRLLRALDRVVEELLDVAPDLVFLGLAQLGVLLQPRAETLDRVALRPFLEQVLGDVEGVVVHGVALHAERHALDQRRPAAVARLLDGALGLAVDGEHIGAVDHDSLEPVRLRTVGDVLDGVAEVRRRRVRPLVVVADEHDREAPDPGKVHALVGVAARGGALAEPGERDARLLPDPEGERAADRDRQHRRQVADHRDRPEAQVGHVHVSVTPARRPILAAHVVREDPPRFHPARDLDAQVAVQHRRDVVGPHRHRHPDRRALVPASGVERARDLALPVKDVAALLDPTRDQHVAVDRQQVLAIETRLSDLGQGADRLRFTRDRHRAETLSARRA